MLGLFDRTVAMARRRYREYMKKGIGQGRRTDLIGGGLIRSMRGWSEVKRARKGGDRLKGDERILGDSRFVMEALKASEDDLERRYQLRAQGYDVGRLARRVARFFEIALKPYTPLVSTNRG